MQNRFPKTRTLIVAPIAIVLGLAAPECVNASVVYTYDQLGRVSTAVYDNGICVAYTYDVNGNRTSQTNTLGGTPATAQWGSGVWGCFKWAP